MAATKNKKLRNTLIVIGSIFGFLLVLPGILIGDFTNNTPSYVKNVEGVETSDYLGDKAERELADCGPFDDFEYLFTEQELNELMATIVPTIDIPAVKIKSIYFDIDENNGIKGEAPLWAACYRSCAKLDGKLSYDDTTVTLRLNKVKLNLLNSKFGVVDWVLSDKTIEQIEQGLEDEGVYLDMFRDNKDVVVTMTNYQICKTIAESSKSAGGFLTAAIVAGTISSRNVEFKINEEGLTGIIVHKSLL